jgi:chemotaxis protein methyltransferase CheR
MIYFDTETKRQVVGRLVSVLAAGGYLCIGHSESLHGIRNDLKPVQPAIYHKL